MCLAVTPALVAAAAMTVGGTLMNAQAQSAAMRRANEAAQAAQVAETERQNRYSRDADLTFNKSLGNAERGAQDQQLGDAIAKRRSLYEGAVKDVVPSTDLLSGQSQAPEAVQNYMVKALGDAVEKQRREGAAKANLDAWGDLQTNNAITNSRNAGDIAMQGNFARGSASILPLELQAARMKAQDNKSLLGDLLTAGGMIASMGAGAGMGPSWEGIFGGGGGSLSPKMGFFPGGSGSGPWGF